MIDFVYLRISKDYIWYNIFFVGWRYWLLEFVCFVWGSWGGCNRKINVFDK